MNMLQSLPRRRAMQGFTLVELIMVIVIVGILSAVALPRFYDTSSSARTAANNSLYAAVNSAMVITHSVALTKGIASSASDTTAVTMDGSGTPLTMVYGYPDVTTINAALNSSFAAPATTATTATWTIAGASGTCNVVYTQAASATLAATLTQTTSGC